MRVIFDTDQDILIDPATGVAATTLVAQRGSGEHIQLLLIRRGSTWQAPELAQFVFIAKDLINDELPNFGTGEVLAGTSGFTYDSVIGEYQAEVSYVVPALDDLMTIGADPESMSATIAAQFAWRPSSSDSWRRCQWVSLQVYNNIWRGDEDLPDVDPSESGGGPYLRPTVKHIKSDVSSSALANTLVDVTGLSFPVDANKTYGFRFVIPFTSGNALNGSRWGVNGPTATSLYLTSQYTLTTTSQTVNFVSSYDSPAAANASSINGVNMAFLEGVVKASAAGNVIARFAGELASNVVLVKAGANVTYWEMDMT